MTASMISLFIIAAVAVSGSTLFLIRNSYVAFFARSCAFDCAEKTGDIDWSSSEAASCAHAASNIVTAGMASLRITPRLHVSDSQASVSRSLFVEATLLASSILPLFYDEGPCRGCIAGPTHAIKDVPNGQDRGMELLTGGTQSVKWA